MLKKNKLVSFGLAMGIGLTAIFANGYSTMGASESGYELYKSAWKKTHAMKSYTGNLHATLTDNGKKKLNIDSVSQTNQNQDTGHRKMQFTVGGKKHVVDFYSQKDHHYMKLQNGKVYQMNKEGKWKHSEKDWDNNQESGEIRETIFNALFGNIKQQVQVKDMGKGSKNVSLHLENKQIPAFVQAIVSIMMKKSGDNEMPKHSPVSMIPGLADQMKKQKPKLTQDVKIQSVDVQSLINKSNVIEEQQAKIQVTGKDATGKTHQLTVNIEFDRSKMNQTTPEQLDLKGKKVQKISMEKQ